MAEAPTNGDLDALILWREALIEEEGGKMFMGLPDRWMDDPHFRCTKGHVSTCILKSEAKGGDCCLACGEFCVLTFPEDEE